MSETPKQTLPGFVEPTASRRELLIGGAFAAAALTTFAFKPRRHVEYLEGRKLEDLVPKQFAGWKFVTASGLVLPPQDQLRDKVYNQLLTRVYADGHGAQIMLLIAYNGAQDGVVQIHRPEVCYPAGGYKLIHNQEHQTELAPTRSIPSRYIIAEDAVRSETIIYWTRVGSEFPRKWAEQRWSVFTQNLHGNIPDGLLVRISSADITDPALLDSFARSLYASVGLPMQHVLAGL